MIGACAAIGCQKTATDEEIALIPKGYIHFNAAVGGTRAELVEQMEGHNFGVSSFNYTGNWQTVQVQAKPNVFYNQQIMWNENTGLHTYSPLKEWESGKKYTFFGHYPYGNSNLTLSSNSLEGTPYLNFTLPGSATQMVDVMTASLYDTDYALSNSVGLSFKHRLVAMGAQARNFNSQHEGKDVYIKLSDVSIKFTNLQYNKATISFDDTLPLERSATSGWRKEATYQLVDKNKSLIIAPTNANTGETTAVDVTGEQGTTLILIPQEAEGETGLQGEVTFTFDYVTSQGNKLPINNAASTGKRTMAFDTGKSMVAGRKYALQMNFSRTSVTIAIVDSGEWVDQFVDIEFE